MTNLIFWVLVCFSWRPNTESDLAGYRLYHGVQSGVYTNSAWIPVNSPGVSTDRIRTCLSAPRGCTNYFVLTAVNYAGMESLPSIELVSTNLVPVVRIAFEGSKDLMVWREIGASELTLVATNIQGFYRARIEVR